MWLLLLDCGTLMKALQCFETLGPIYSITDNILEDSRPATPLWGPQISQCHAKEYVADNTFNTIFSGRQPSQDVKVYRCFENDYAPFLRVCWWPGRTKTHTWVFNPAVFIAPLGRARNWMRMNCHRESFGIYSTYFDLSDFLKHFGLEERWRMFPGARMIFGEVFWRMGNLRVASHFRLFQWRLSVLGQVYDNGLYGIEFLKYKLSETYLKNLRIINCSSILLWQSPQDAKRNPPQYSRKFVIHAM